jgi:hypothetical protein
MAGLVHLELLTDFFNAIDPERHFTIANYCIAKGSLDHLVGATKQRQRHADAERLGDPEVNAQLDFGCLLKRNVWRRGVCAI